MAFNRWCLLIAVLVYFTAAWSGVGYHAEDEFQHVILFAEHLRGNVDAASLPLDFHQHWRSMVQPLLCAAVFGVCEAVGITDPFQLTLALRLLTAALALWIMHGFIRTMRPLIKPENEKAFVLLSWFLWFLPVLQIRFTGEAWSGLFFLRGLGLLLSERSPFRIGAWFGLAILFRPAAALLPFGALLWLVFVRKTQRKRILLLVVAILGVLLAGVLIDRAVYGSPVLTLWNYVQAAMTGAEAERFTTLPWYQHALFVAKYAALPIGSLLLFAFVLLLLLRPKHILVWVILPFFIVHSVLPIKEPRFLFPLAPLAPWLLLAAWEGLQERWPALMHRKIWMQLLFPFAVVNVLALIVGMLTPAGNGRIHLAEAIYERFDGQRVHVDQLGDWRQWIPPFFLARQSTERFTDKIVVDPKVNGPVHLVIAKRSLELDRIDNLERMAVTSPAWCDRLLSWYALEDVHDPLVLYFVTTQYSGH